MTLESARVPVLSLLVLAACGPEAGASPKTGVYHFEVAMIENTCDPVFDDDAKGEDVVEVMADTIVVPMSEVLSYAVPTCENCAPLTALVEWSTQLDPESGLYVADNERSFMPSGCVRERIEVEVLDERTLQARFTAEVARGDTCPWKDTVTADCVVTREFTFTRVED